MKYKTQTTVQNWAVVIGCLVLLGLLTSLNSCTSCSESGRRQQTPAISTKEEKVVIIMCLDPVYTVDIVATTYKVKIVSQGVVTWVRVLNQPMFEVGDTILYRFTE